ncbi:MAG TPA: periplasmic heavy metal sensor [Hyphomicrobiaceae bacterium]|jgi:Spy/CpxP family protein refolding chaperone|nr:periplasmic heavy metal sensor [Hyphomicrobiaceae bacterium]
MKRTLAAWLLSVPAGFALAQTHQPYAGMQQRSVKALSEQQIADLRAGRGMGLALPAELNGYPGPMHVLEHADALGLTSQQRERTKALIEAMRAEAIPVGERLIEQETRLDRLFANQEITPAALTAATADIGATQAKLREAHLKYHLTMMDVLTPQQVAEYRHLRGYASSGPMQHHKQQH